MAIAFVILVESVVLVSVVLVVECIGCFKNNEIPNFLSISSIIVHCSALNVLNGIFVGCKPWIKELF